MSLWAARKSGSVSAGGPGFWLKEVLLAAFCAGIGEWRCEKKPFLPRFARELASVGTDGRRFWRGTVPALPTVPDFGAARRWFY